MTIPNCIVIDESNQLIKDLKQKFPQKSFEELKAEVGTFMGQSNMLNRLPTMEEMNQYYSEKEKNFEVPIEGVEEVVNQSNISQLRTVQSEKEYADFSVLDEISNLTFRNAQRKADRVNLIAREFSKVVDVIYNKYVENARENGEEPQSRRAFVANNAFKITNIVKKRSLNPELIPQDDADYTYKFNEIQKIQDNWTILLGEAANILYTTEGVNLDVYNEKAAENVNQEAENEDDITPNGENNISLKDGWMVKARELDLRDTLSAETRKILSSIERVDRNGNPDVDDLGMKRYLEPDTAHLILVEKISTINNAGEFIPALNELAIRHPWVNQILKTIQEDNENSEFPSIEQILYSDLRKEFVPYYVQLRDSSGKIITKQVNRNPSIFYLLDRWRMQFEQGSILSDYSIYNNKGEYSKKNAEKGISVINDINKKLNTLDEAQVSNYIIDNVDRISKLLNMIGIDFSNDEIISTLTYGDSVLDNVNNLLSALTTIFSQVSKNEYTAGTDIVNEFSGVFSEIATLFNTVPQGTVIATFREAGKTRQSYSSPSYIGRLHNGIKQQDDTKAISFIEDNYGKYRTFKDENGYKLYWLDLMTDESEGKFYRNLLDRKIVVHKEGKEFDDWTEEDYVEVALNEFISTLDSNFAWYALPLLADAPSAEFIKFKRITDKDEIGIDGKFRDTKEVILDKLADVAYNEWERIQVVERRSQILRNPDSKLEGEETISPIASFDGNAGRRFNFFPSLNTKEIVDSLRGKSVAEAKSVLRKLIEDYEEQSFQEFYSKYGYIAATNNISPKVLEEFFYNNGLAYTQMVQLYTTDLAYYKNLNDFQKRFKEVYAMTNRLYTAIPDISNIRKVVYLKDITFTSPVLRELEEALDNAVKEGRISKISKDYILSQYTKTKEKEGINDTDAQGFVTLNSYKKVMRMLGKWTSNMERAKERFENGTFDVKDFNIIWQTLKPFEFTHTESRSGVLLNNKGQNIPYGNLKVPTQYKNSEFLLLAIYNSIALSQSKSPLLRELNDWMVKNDIDLVQFESGVKTGNQAAINLNNFSSTEEINATLNSAISNPETIHYSSWEDYGIQSATPEHLVDHEALIGSQAKKLITADLPSDFTTSLQGNLFNREAIYNLFQNLLSFGYVDGFKECVDIFSSTENVAAAIQKEMAGNTRYTDEERKACTLRPDKQDFNVPLHDPVQFSRIQQLLNSIIKKKITKQQTTGAACIQVSNVGLTDELKVRFNDENGNLIFTEDEWLDNRKISRKAEYQRIKSLIKDYGYGVEGFNEYRNKVKSKSMAYMECYLPAYTKKFFNVLGRTEGNFNIEDLPEELRKCLGYRIPTEAKYSMQNLYIKGFLPQVNGSAIMLPSEITTIVGSDFDVDKVYLMLPNVGVGSYSKDEAKKEFLSLNKDYSIEDLEDIFGEDIIDETPRGKRANFNKWLKLQREEGKYLLDKDGMYHGKKDSYIYKPSINLNKYVTTDKDGNIKDFKYKEFFKEVPEYKRDNLILDIFLQVLSNPSIVAQQLKPGGFAEASKQAALITILDNLSAEDLINRFTSRKAINKDSLKEAFDVLNSYDLNTLKNIASESSNVLNPLSFDTQVYFHSQNANGGRMIGVYAVGNASHCVGEWGSTKLKEEFMFLGTPLYKIDNFLASDGSLISENLANFLAASVDNVKDPVLKALNQNPSTGDVTNFLLRAGVPLSKVSLFITTEHPVFDKTTISTVSDQVIELSKSLTEDDILNYKKGILSESENSLVGEALGYLDYKINKFSKDLTEITQAFRGDALNSAAGPSIGHNIIRILKLQKLLEDLQSKTFSLTTDLLDVESLLDNENYSIDNILTESYNQKVPFLYSATKCGVTGSNYLLSNVFPQLGDKLLRLVTDSNFGLSRYINLTKMKSNEAAKLIDSFFSELDLYLLQGTKYFGETNTKQKNLYYLNEFPDRFLELKEKYPLILNTNSFTKNLIVSSPYKGFKRIMFTNSGNLTKSLKETITNDWAMLLATKEQKEINSEGKEITILPEKDAEEIRNLGFELFKYATNFGLEFSGGKSYVQFTPNILRRAIKDYDRTIREVGTASSLTPFIQQFIHNHFELANLYAVYKGEPKFGEGGTFTKITRDLNYPKMYVVQDDILGDVLYEAYDESVSKDNRGNDVIYVSYKRATQLGTLKGFKEYYYGVVDPDTVIKEEYKKEVNDSSSYEDNYIPPQYDETYNPETDDLPEEYTDTPSFSPISVYDSEGRETKLC